MKFIKSVQTQQVQTITLARAAVRNAFHPEMIEELRKAFEEVAHNSSIRVVRLNGEGADFCAGADLEWMKSMVNFSESENEADSDKLFAMFAAIRQCPKPVIAMVHGNVMGGGVGLVAASDLVVAHHSTKFCFSEVKLGLMPAVISSFVLAKMNYAGALQTMLTAEVFSADQARQWGLIQFSGEPAACDKEVERLQQLILKAGPEAVAATKAHVREIHERFVEARKLSVERIATRRISREGQEGLAAFLNKREPSWRGQS